MERREDIRAAMQSLLSPARRLERETLRPIEIPRPAPPPSGPTLALSERQQRMLGELQATLRENGIQAELSEIVQAIMEALTARPTLCRGLVAAYLLGEV